VIVGFEEVITHTPELISTPVPQGRCGMVPLVTVTGALSSCSTGAVIGEYFE